MSKPLSFHPEAIAEATEARRWYAVKRQETADGFLRELRAGYDAISQHPSIYPHYEKPYRFYKLKRYPYLIIYAERNEVIEVLAVAHDKREPGYWKSRAKG